MSSIGWLSILPTYFLVLGLLGMFASYSIAKRKGLSTNLAAFWGFFGGLIAVIVYALLASKKQPMSTYTNGNKDNVGRLLSIASMFCTALGLLSVLSGGGILFFNSTSFFPDHRLNTIIISLIIILNLLAVILGVVLRRRNPTLASRKDTKAGLLLNALFLVLFTLIGLLSI